MTSPARRRPALLRALGDADPPATVELGGTAFRRVTIFKHDSWAATGLYEASGGARAVCKFNRHQPIFGLPAAWLGRWLARRETRFLRLLADRNEIPDDLGPVVVDGHPADNAVARAFVEGVPLYKFQPVSDDFFDRLQAALVTMHERGITYNDLHKVENIIVGANGRPYLIDFQVSLQLSRRWPARAILKQLSALDCYHVAKHIFHCRPDLSSGPVTPPALVRVLRLVSQPLRKLRRWVLVTLSVRTDLGHAHSESEPEDAVRRRLVAGLPNGMFERLRSNAYYASCGGDDTAFIRGLYRDVLRRDAKDDEVASWTVALRREGRARVAADFLESREYALLAGQDRESK